MLVHGFESPYQIWIDYIEHYKENYHILVPILPGHDVREKSEFNSFDDTAKEIENYCISKSASLNFPSTLPLIRMVWRRLAPS